MGEYFADLAVNDVVVVEVKSVKLLLPEHDAQLLNYLKATHFEVGPLLNFGPQPECRRKVYDNERKRMAPGRTLTDADQPLCKRGPLFNRTRIFTDSRWSRGQDAESAAAGAQ